MNTFSALEKLLLNWFTCIGVFSWAQRGEINLSPSFGPSSSTNTTLLGCIFPLNWKEKKKKKRERDHTRCLSTSIMKDRKRSLNNKWDYFRIRVTGAWYCAYRGWDPETCMVENLWIYLHNWVVTGE
jgi:hypothetical protein